MSVNRDKLEELYNHYNNRKFVHPDPLEFLYDYSDPLEREIAGIVASSLAYGRVAQILKSVSFVLDRIGRSPRSFIMNSSKDDFNKAFSRFKHRFTTGKEISSMLLSIRQVIERFGSLHNCFMTGFNEKDDNILPALSGFVDQLNINHNGSKNSLIPSPVRGSACKRLILFMRWMVRKDHVDPGGWEDIPPSRLIIPLDTHMHKICGFLDLTCRKQADMNTAIEITKGFREIAPEDPVKYDFALTRLGIRKDADLDSFLKSVKI